MTRYQLSLPGPTEYDPEVLAELLRPTTPHYGEQWVKTYASILELLKRIHQTRNRVYILPGSGSCGVDAVFTSLGKKRGLILDNGTFGTRLATIASRHLARLQVIEKPPGVPFEAGEIARKLDEEQYDLLAMVHGETSTGMLNRLEEAAEICKSKGLLFIVDAVSTLAGVPLPVDRLGIDFCVSASQKALGAPPGLATVSVSERGWQAMPEEAAIQGWYLNLRTWAWYEREWADWHPFPVTLPVNLYLALKKSMELILAEGLEAVWERHRRVSEELQERLLQMQVKLLIERKEHRLPTVTAGILPEGLASAELLEHLREDYGILIAGGVGPLRKSIFRVGHMGYSAQSWLVKRVASGIAEFLRARGRLPGPRA